MTCEICTKLRNLTFQDQSLFSYFGTCSLRLKFIAYPHAKHNASCAHRNLARCIFCHDMSLLLRGTIAWFYFPYVQGSSLPLLARMVGNGSHLSVNIKHQKDPQKSQIVIGLNPNPKGTSFSAWRTFAKFMIQIKNYRNRCNTNCRFDATGYNRIQRYVKLDNRCTCDIPPLRLIVEDGERENARPRSRAWTLWTQIVSVEGASAEIVYLKIGTNQTFRLCGVLCIVLMCTDSYH